LIPDGPEADLLDVEASAMAISDGVTLWKGRVGKCGLSVGWRGPRGAVGKSKNRVRNMSAISDGITVVWVGPRMGGSQERQRPFCQAARSQRFISGSSIRDCSQSRLASQMVRHKALLARHRSSP